MRHLHALHIYFGCWVVALCALALPTRAASDQLPAAPRLEFTPPAAGTYKLHAIQRAPHGVVIDSDGASRPLSRYTTGRVTLLSFVYTYCTDSTGCPLAYETFVAVRARLLERAELARRVRLVSLSFDPTHDTPAMLRAYGGDYLKPDAGVAWAFLTTRSVAALTPILDGFGQDVAVERDQHGRPTRVINHMLKVFLLDERGMVREIYSAAFLFPEVVFNDIVTLLMEEAATIGQR
jgi:protein SCO1